MVVVRSRRDPKTIANTTAASRRATRVVASPVGGDGATITGGSAHPQEASNNPGTDNYPNDNQPA